MSSTVRTLLVGLLVIFSLWLSPSFNHPSSWLQFTPNLVREEPLSHPIPKLMVDAELKYKKLISKQSRTLQAAVAQYRDRYERDPPKGFDEWFAFAMDNNVKIVDEYDSMMDDLAPFWDLTGEEVRRRATQIGYLPSIDLVRLKNGKTTVLRIQNGFNDSEVSARAHGFRVMIEKFQHKLPDLDFPINANAEGRILVPWGYRMYPELTKTNSSGGIESMIGGTFIPDWRGDGNVWEEFRRTCEPSTPARHLFDSIRKRPGSGQQPLSYLHRLNVSERTPLQHDRDLSFAQRPDNTYDFCQHPWARYQQGHFFSDWRTLRVLYPVFSPAKAAGFGDILIPSHYYYSSTKRYTYGWDPARGMIHDIDKNEVPWENKTDRIFWRGATTGGGNSPPGFTDSYQRHRFIDMVNGNTNMTQSIVFAHPPGLGRFVRADVPVQMMNAEFIDAAFTKAVGCGDDCDAVWRRYRFADPVPMGEHWRHKYLVDFDGMGYSARVMAFLASGSAVLKATVYHEYFTDWIQPWLHYIPLSQSYSEIYNIHAYFSGPSPSMRAAINATMPTSIPGHLIRAANEGDRQLAHIAKAGSEWKRTVGRKVDMEVYVYRLCLEYARLSADDREAMSYNPL